MSVIELNIKKPTTISAGAVAKDGIAVKIGAKNIDSANSTATVIEVRPVLPPAATPAEDSTNVVVGKDQEQHLELTRRFAKNCACCCGNSVSKKRRLYLRKSALFIKHICL